MAPDQSGLMVNHLYLIQKMCQNRHAEILMDVGMGLTVLADNLFLSMIDFIITNGVVHHK